jgi:hypothetical protein
LHRIYLQGSHRYRDFQSVLGIPIEDEKPRSRIKRKRFSQLLDDPQSIGISCHIEVQDLTPVVANDKKAVQNTKRERWDGEEVHRRNGFAMVSEERQPSLHELWISRSTLSVFRRKGPRLFKTFPPPVPSHLTAFSVP